MLAPLFYASVGASGGKWWRKGCGTPSETPGKQFDNGNRTQASERTAHNCWLTKLQHRLVASLFAKVRTTQQCRSSAICYKGEEVWEAEASENTEQSHGTVCDRERHSQVLCKLVDKNRFAITLSLLTQTTLVMCFLYVVCVGVISRYDLTYKMSLYDYSLHIINRIGK